MRPIGVPHLAKWITRIRPMELAEIVKRITGITYCKTQIGCRTFWLDPASDFGQRLLSDHGYEPELCDLLRELLRPGDTFVDVGANEGYFSVIASELVGPSGRVYAVEPQPRLWPVIIRNFLLNQQTNYSLVPYAVGMTEGVLDLFVSPSINTGSTTAVGSYRRWFCARESAVLMPLVDVMEKYGISSVAVMKIDIEGFELNALKSLGSHLADGSIRNVLVELHPAQLSQLGQTVEQVAEILIKSGYTKQPNEAIEHWRR